MAATTSRKPTGKKSRGVFAILAVGLLIASAQLASADTSSGEQATCNVVAQTCSDDSVCVKCTADLKELVENRMMMRRLQESGDEDDDEEDDEDDDEDDEDEDDDNEDEDDDEDDNSNGEMQ